MKLKTIYAIKREITLKELKEIRKACAFRGLLLRIFPVIECKICFSHLIFDGIMDNHQMDCELSNPRKKINIEFELENLCKIQKAMIKLNPDYQFKISGYFYCVKCGGGYPLDMWYDLNFFGCRNHNCRKKSK